MMSTYGIEPAYSYSILLPSMGNKSLLKKSKMIETKVETGILRKKKKS